jgi:hemoglobin
MKELPVNRPELRALFQRIGGETGLLETLNDFYQRMSQDVMIGFFFEGKDLGAIAAKQAEFLMKAMGVTSSYRGKAPAQAHSALPPILAGHFDRRIQILRETLRARGLNDADIRTWTTFENAFREGIVQK